MRSPTLIAVDETRGARDVLQGRSNDSMSRRTPVDQGVREPQDCAAQDFGPLVATPPAGTNGTGVYGAANKDSAHDRTHSPGTDQLHC